jgi:hypothetical protein
MKNYRIILALLMIEEEFPSILSELKQCLISFRITGGTTRNMVSLPDGNKEKEAIISSGIPQDGRPPR